jgi:topoisomerase-4 subunit A
VIVIIRTEDEPKTVMMAEFGLTDRQAEAILNMRLRSLRRLEEMEIGRERTALAKERADLAGLIEDKAKQRRRMKKQLAEVKAKFGDGRRTHLQESAGARAEIDWSAMIEKEPITVILSQRGWIRAMKGHVALDDAETLKFREGDGLHLIFHAQTTDKLLLGAATGCRVVAGSASRCDCRSTCPPRSRSRPCSWSSPT